MCSAGFSTAAIQNQIESIQAKCSVGTGLAEVAMRSYLSSQVLGFITDLQSVKEIGSTVPIIEDADGKRKPYKEWADALTAAAKGRLGGRPESAEGTET